MRTLITGSKGQLGLELLRSRPPIAEILANDIDELDITDPGAVEKVVRSFLPDVIINAAAYTAVDLAESQQEIAFAVNAGAAENLATSAQRIRARMIHISTDFVFDGHESRPYSTDSPPAPLSVYGKSKLEGESRVSSKLRQDAVIIRTSWLYSSNGGNFVKTIIRLLQEKDELRVVSDQIGTPTWAFSLAEAIWSISQDSSLSGTLHWTDLGVCSWYDFAVAIQEESVQQGLLKRSIPIRPIKASEYPTPAQRPRFSVLDTADSFGKIGRTPLHWRVALRKMLTELRDKS